jgi:hypothetical protein
MPRLLAYRLEAGESATRQERDVLGPSWIANGCIANDFDLGCARNVGECLTGTDVCNVHPSRFVGGVFALGQINRFFGQVFDREGCVLCRVCRPRRVGRLDKKSRR